ncbi:MAG: glycogen/starch synthase [Bacteroidota bacterium]
MKKVRMLFVSQEITPYLDETEMSIISRNLPQGILEAGKEIRTFMPRYGCINERRHQLHEVIRLSGMNLIINDFDHSLIIKVASVPTARMQVYFIDNEDYFSRNRKSLITDKNGNIFTDTDERIIFFCRGVIETVRKLGWAPHIVHCHGWMTSLIPMYLKRSFADDPLFAESRVIYSMYNDEFQQPLNKEFSDKVYFEGIEKDDVKWLKSNTYAGLIKTAIDFSDAVIKVCPEINSEVERYIQKTGRFVLEHPGEDYIDTYNAFYDEVLSEEAVFA